MYKFFLALFTTLFIINATLFSQCVSPAANFLKNPGFESPLMTGNTNGNNLLGVFTWSDWNMTGGAFNVIRVNGTGYFGGPNTAHNGIQYLDITSGAGTITQNFTLTCPTDVTFSGWFSSRENGYTNWTASIDIIRVSDNVVMGSSTSRLFTSADADENPSDAVWYQVTGSITNLAAGTYRFSANVGDYGNFDDAYLCGNPLCLLPVKLISFAGEKTSSGNQLNWKTSDEVNFQKFVIERSMDGNHFTSIAEVSPQAGASGNKDYNYTDIGIISSTVFYRLKMIDNNGDYKYSNLVIIKDAIKNNSIKVYPNPITSNNALVNITSIQNDNNAFIELMDAAGKVVLKKNVTIKTGNQTLNVDVTNLSKGLYILKLNTDAFIYTTKLLKK